MPDRYVKRYDRRNALIGKRPGMTAAPPKHRKCSAEGLVVQGTLDRDERDERVAKLTDVVGLRRKHLDRYPREFTGGQRQRIGIVRALALRSKFVLADEPVSVLDLSVLSLLSDLQREFGLAYLFISDVPVHLVASAPDATWAEFMPDDHIFNFRRLIDTQLVAEAGHLILPQTRGLGFGFDPAAVARYGIRYPGMGDVWARLY